MTVAKDKIVTMHFELSSNGEVIDSSKGQEPLTFIAGNGQMLPSLENALMGKEKGSTFDIDIKAADAYGEYQPEGVHTVPVSAFNGADLEPGMQFQAGNEQGQQIIVIKEVKGDEVIVDGNHPLAGKDLLFSVELVDVRDATADELSHGHAHGEGGCGHEH